MRAYELSKEHIAIINRKCHDLKHQLKALAAADDSVLMALVLYFRRFAIDEFPLAPGSTWPS